MICSIQNWFKGTYGFVFTIIYVLWFVENEKKIYILQKWEKNIYLFWIYKKKKNKNILISTSV